mmetsp:Transcript_25074/g.58208  ORF Transcript_25074/g.58208 Transcript_25074/m.58208 type:complete len:533 (-) Transcript_25074:111-1709(-)
MGNQSGSAGSRRLDEATKRAEDRLGKHTITGRYHRPPKCIEDDYERLGTVLGTGYSGAVYLAKGKESKRKFAVKGFRLHGVSKEKKEELQNEVEIFLSMDHPHIARLVDAYESENTLDLVMECMDGGELYERVVARRKFSEKDAAEAVHQMLLAVNYIHSHGVVHRDLKLENFLYEKKDSDFLKLIDFGFSKVWEPNTLMKMSCGTLAYVAPEVLDKSYTSQCDLWSIGVITFILLVGHMPFGGSESAQISAIRAGKVNWREDRWLKVSRDARDFVSSLLVVDPKKRMTVTQAMEHKWIEARGADGSGHVDEGIIDALCQFSKESKFKRAAFSVMAWSLSREDREQVREAFLELDKEHKGVVSLADLRQVMQSRFEIDDAQINEVFEALDTNHDQEIHYSEFLAAMVSSRIQLHDALLKETFRRFDTDNSGYITLENLKEVLGESFEGEEVEELLAEVDTGSDGKISWEEFIAYLKGTEVPHKVQQAADRMIDGQQSRPSEHKFESPFRIRRRVKETVQRLQQTIEGKAPHS